MRAFSVKQALAALLTMAGNASSRQVFAHYMLGTVTQEHAITDITDAVSMGLDGFALNIGDASQPFVSDTLSYMFGYLESNPNVPFKLYVSMDIYASGNSCYKGSKNACNGPFDYQWIWDSYKASAAYFNYNGLPMITTFSSGGFTNDYWIKWKSGLANDTYFIPDFDETDGYYDGADGWWYYWGDVVDGLNSWESAWPERAGLGGAYVGDVSVDKPVCEGAHAHGKGYMMGLSALQYKNSYGANVYRQGDLNLPIRAVGIASMACEVDFVIIQTWNDGPESHYIGNLWIEQNNDTQPFAYANQMDWPHQGWQSLVASFIPAYKDGVKEASEWTVPSGGLLDGAMWYKTILTSTIECPSDGLTQSYYDKPSGFENGTDSIFWAAILSPDAALGYTAEFYSNGLLLHTQHLVEGFQYGYSGADVSPGAQHMLIKDPSGNVQMTASGGLCVSDGCPDSFYNSNYQVLPFVKDDGSGISDTDCQSGRHDEAGVFYDSSDFDPNAGWRAVSCDTGSLTSVYNNPETQWSDAQADIAWSDALYEWENNRPAEADSFSAFMGDFFHARPGLACEVIGNENCDISVNCGQGTSPNADVNSPAGYLIITSFTDLHSQNDALYQGLRYAEGDMAAEIATFAATFDMYYDYAAEEMLTDSIIALGLGILLAPIFNSWLKAVPFFKSNPNFLGITKDLTSTSISNGATITKELINDPGFFGATALGDFLTKTVQTWTTAVAEYNSVFFNGTDTTMIDSYITDGRGFTLNVTTDVDDLTNAAETALYSLMIPQAWALSNTNTSDYRESGRVYAFIATSEGVPGCNGCDGCEPDSHLAGYYTSNYWNEESKASQVISDSVGKQTFLCGPDDQAYWLVFAYSPPWSGCRLDDEPYIEGHMAVYPCEHPSVKAPYGSDSLNGSAWGGVTVDSLARGSITAWIANGKQNGWPEIDPSNIDDTLVNAIISDGAQAPGLINFPVCSFETAMGNMRRNDPYHEPDHPPCAGDN